MKEMKNSGIEWVGNIPSNWKVMPNKRIMHKQKVLCGKYNGEDILSLTMKGVVTRDLDAGGKIPTTFDGYQIVNPNNLLMCLFDYDVTPRCIGLIKNKGLTSPAYSQFVVDNRNIPNYYYYYYLMIDNTKELLHLAKNLRHSFTEEQLGEIYAPVPPVKEQEKIANFLDEKIKEIDNAIEKTKETIEDYKKLKQSTITKAVTSGIDKNKNMKKINVEWIKEIPENWEIIKVKHTSNLKGRIGWQGLNSGDYIEEGPYLITGTDFVDGKICWNSCVHITNERFEEAPEIHIKENDLLITKDGTIGKVAIVKNCPEKVSINSGVLLIRNLEKYKYDKVYMYYLLQSEQFKLWYQLSQTGNSTIKHLYQEQFSNFKYTFPPLEEQQKIGKYLDNKIKKINDLIISKEKVVEDLENYKNSVIYEYVTGKKEVK